MPNCDLGYCHNNPNSYSPCPTSSQGSLSERAVDGQVSTSTSSAVVVSTSSSAGTPEAGCSYSYHPCVCKLRCPAGQVRYGDGSACTGGGVPNCDLGYCHNNPNPIPLLHIGLFDGPRKAVVQGGSGRILPITRTVLYSASSVGVSSFKIVVGDDSSAPDAGSNAMCGGLAASSSTLSANSNVETRCRLLQGRYVFVASQTASAALTIAEFEVYGTVAPGYYADGVGASASIVPCPAGSYCLGGPSHAGPVGRYGSSTQLYCSTCDGKCTAGYHCGSGSVSRTSEPCAPAGVANPATYFCVAGVGRQLAPQDYFTLPEGGNERYRTGIAPCPDDGSVCKNGIRQELVDQDFCKAGQARTVYIDTAATSSWSLALAPPDSNETFRFSLYDAHDGYDIPVAMDYHKTARWAPVSPVLCIVLLAPSKPWTLMINLGGSGRIHVICDYRDLLPSSWYRMTGMTPGPWTIFQRRVDSSVDSPQLGRLQKRFWWVH